MRSRVAVVGLIVALCAAAAGIALAVAAITSGDGREPAPSASEAVTATDFCYVESMIYYRVETTDITDALQRKDGITPEARSLAAGLAAAQSTALEELRPWYVSWTGSRPLAPAEGPCAGHGDHAQMPGMPTPAQWTTLIAADPAAAERLFAELLIAQNEAMIAFAEAVLQEDPHTRVRESAAAAIAEAEDDIAALEDLLAQLP